MRIYLVGGAVRDHLLARLHPHTPQAGDADRDWVVVGATPAEMLQQGYRPVGQDFPVFLHPDTHEEYALARTERKSGVGYKGFTFHTSQDTTLEEDLARRDLTINAMALPLDKLGQLDSDGLPPALVDPYDGLEDLRAGVLRHVTPAFEEDPLRILRVARFAARWPTFVVAPETQDLIRRMVAQGEVQHLVPERVWQELARGLMAHRPSRMLQVLVQCDAWPALLAPMPSGPLAQQAVDQLADVQAPLPVRFAALWIGASPADLMAFCRHHRIPRACEDVAAVALKAWPAWLALLERGAPALWPLLQGTDAVRRPERLEQVTRCWLAWSSVASTSAPAQRLGELGTRLSQALEAALRTPLPASARGLQGPAVGQALAQARQQAAENAWNLL